MTPNLVATTALINFDHPNAPAAGLPGLTNPGTQAYGEYAAGVWAQALATPLASQRWTWPDRRCRASTCPTSTGLDLASAQARLRLAGLQDDATRRGQPAAVREQGPVPASVAFYGAADRPRKGATITVCPSSRLGPVDLHTAAAAAAADAMTKTTTALATAHADVAGSPTPTDAQPPEPPPASRRSRPH